MKNMRKVLAAVLALTLVLGMFAFSVSAETFSDVPSDASYAEAVNISTALGLIVGRTDGTFDPDGTITRAEFAAVICRALGLETAANGSTGPTDFKDVPVDHWATGYINIASRQKLIVGYGDGNFGPDDPITYEQAVKLIVAALGYTPRANYQGGYPSGYLAVASANGILDNVIGVNGQPASRAMVIQMLYDALDVTLMEQTGGSTINPTYEPVPGHTLLATYLRVTKVEGVVTSTDYTAVNKAADDRQVTINAIDTTGLASAAGARFNMGSTDAEDYLGQQVVAYAKSISGETTLVAISPKANRNNILVLDEIENVVGKQVDASGSYLEYWVDVRDNEPTNVQLVADNQLKAVYNGGNTDVAFIDTKIAPINNRVAMQNGSITLIDYNNDNRYEYVFVDEYRDIVVDEVTSRGQVTDKNNSGSVRFDATDTTYRFTLTLDGAEIQPADLQEFDVVSVYETRDNTVKKGVVTRGNAVEGRIMAVTPDGTEYTYTIDGTDYKKASALATNLSTETEGKFILNAAGRIVYVDTEGVANSQLYGFVIAAGVTNNIDATAQFKMLTANGTWITYNAAARVKLNGTSYSSSTLSNQQVSVLKNKVVTYKLDANNNVSSISTAGNHSTSQIAYNGSAKYFGQNPLRDDAVVFALASGKSLNDTLDTKDVTVNSASVFVDSQEYTVATFTNNNGEIAAVLAQDLAALIPADARLFVVRAVGTATSPVDGETVKTVSGYYPGDIDETTLYTSSDIGGKISMIAASNYVIDQTSNNALYDGLFKEINADGQGNPLSENLIIAGSVISFALDANGEIAAARIIYTPNAGNNTPNVDLSATKFYAGIFTNDANADEVKDVNSARAEGYIFGEVFNKESNNATLGVIGASSGNKVLNLASAKIAKYDYQYGRAFGEMYFGDLERYIAATGDRGSIVLIKTYNSMSQDAIILELPTPVPSPSPVPQP